MALTVNERYAIIRELAPRYQKVRKRERTKILDEFVRVTNLVRPYASHVLKHYGSRKIVTVNGQRCIVVVGERPHAKRHRPRCYDQTVLDALQRLWALSNGLCGKRLVVFIRQTLPVLERFGGLCVDDAVRTKLLTVSASTIDRLLASTKAKSRLKGRSGTKPGTLLKHHIPIRTFADWNEALPGFVEVDLVAHDGGLAFGEFAQTLDVTDIATTWTETRALKNKAQCYVFQALQDVRKTLPFSLCGIDSDNGSEFINNHLRRYCEAEHITFTRSRPYRKNDNCFVEQKNYSIVRNTVAYYRYDQPDQLQLLHRIYQLLRLYTNFFQPSMKLREKSRVGSRVTRRYDPPMTPYQRVLEHPAIVTDTKHQLSSLYQTLNPAQLMRSMAELQQELFDSALQVPKNFAPPRLYAPQHHPWRQTSLASQRKYLNHFPHGSP